MDWPLLEPGSVGPLNVYDDLWFAVLFKLEFAVDRCQSDGVQAVDVFTGELADDLGDEGVNVRRGEEVGCGRRVRDFR